LKAESIKQEIDSWLNLTSAIQGDTIIINRDLESEVKLMSATKFTISDDKPSAICSLGISESDLSPHYLNNLYWENFNLI
jgi:hypothetical protein